MKKSRSMKNKRKKDPMIFLGHILESIELIESYTKKINKSEFKSNSMLQDSVLRRIEIIGEAAKNLPLSFKRKNENIPWKQIAGMRDKVIHAYFGIDLDLVWVVVKKDIKLLKTNIKKYFEKN